MEFIRESLKTHPLVRVVHGFSTERGDDQGINFYTTINGRKFCLLEFSEARWKALLDSKPLDRYAEVRRELFVRLAEIARNEGWRD